MVQCVYKISCIDENIKEFYIGSTDNLKERITCHKSRYNCNNNNTKIYKFIRENGGLSNWEINPIEIFSFLTEEELRQHEQFYIDEYKPQLNCVRAYLSPEQKNIDHKNRTKKYYENNKDAIYKWNRQYQIKNKEKTIEYKKKSYAKHAQEYAKKRKEKANCPHCNKEMLKMNISRHIKKIHPTS